MQFRNFLKLFLLLLFAGLSACSVAGSNDPNKPVDVHVTATDYAFQSSMTTFKVGVPYHFIVTNQGTVEHEFMIVKPIKAGTMDMEEMDSMALADIEDDDLKPGTTATVDLTFTQPAPAGTLEFACHLPKHYEAGMKLPITVQ